MTEDLDRDAVDRYFAAWEGWDLDTIGSLLADDAVDRRPQSGERFAGRSNILGMYTNLAPPAIAWASIRGAFPIWIAEGTVNYGEGPVCLIGIVEVREGEIRQADFYFANPFDPPPTEPHGRNRPRPEPDGATIAGSHSASRTWHDRCQDRHEHRYRVRTSPAGTGEDRRPGSW